MTDLYARMGDYRQMMAEAVSEYARGLSVLVLGSGDLPLELSGYVCRVDANAKAKQLDVVADAAHLPFADQSFGVIIAMELIEHVKKPYLLLDEVSRVLTTDGTLLLTTPNAAHLLSRSAMLLGAFIEDRTLHEDSIDHLHFFDRGFLRKQLQQRFPIVVEAHRFITLPGFRYLPISHPRGLCYQLAFICSRGGHESS